ncbi:MAG: DUF2461 domain-containing protein, partial [Chloroflexi bacterium]|nr:DUF2461 domain-containing protein [Chloroflexota bacterium]
GYFHLEPGGVFVGGGMWHPAPARLAAWRNAVIGDRVSIRAVVEDPMFVSEFGAVDGDRLKRAPKGFAQDDPDIELLKLKDVVFGRPLADDDVLGSGLPAQIADALVHATPLLRLLAGLPGHETDARWLRD